MNHSKLFQEYKTLTKDLEGQKTTALSTLIYGKVKIGKTTLAATAAEVGETLLFNFENRLAHIPENDNLIFFPNKNSICTIQNLENLITSLKNNPDHGIKFVVFDTLDSFFFELEREVYKKKNKVNLNFEERKQINLIINSFISEFKNDLGINVIVTAHEKDNDEGRKVSLGLASDLKRLVNKYIDNLFYLDINTKNERVIYTKPNWAYEAGQSSRLGEELPDFIINPTMKDLIKI